MSVLRDQSRTRTLGSRSSELGTPPHQCGEPEPSSSNGTINSRLGHLVPIGTARLLLSMKCGDFGGLGQIFVPKTRSSKRETAHAIPHFDGLGHTGMLELDAGCRRTFWTRGCGAGTRRKDSRCGTGRLADGWESDSNQVLRGRFGSVLGRVRRCWQMRRWPFAWTLRCQSLWGGASELRLCGIAVWTGTGVCGCFQELCDVRLGAVLGQGGQSWGVRCHDLIVCHFWHLSPIAYTQRILAYPRFDQKVALLAGFPQHQHLHFGC